MMNSSYYSFCIMLSMFLKVIMCVILVRMSLTEDVFLYRWLLVVIAILMHFEGVWSTVVAKRIYTKFDHMLFLLETGRC